MNPAITIEYRDDSTIAVTTPRAAYLATYRDDPYHLDRIDAPTRKRQQLVRRLIAAATELADEDAR